MPRKAFEAFMSAESANLGYPGLHPILALALHFLYYRVEECQCRTHNKCIAEHEFRRALNELMRVRQYPDEFLDTRAIDQVLHELGKPYVVIDSGHVYLGGEVFKFRKSAFLPEDSVGVVLDEKA